ncbi:MAG: class I SAM-dependent methyltransferase [Chromatiales bacterium]|nr:class I SAM-dependent methyltransferase [Chromatiales bacterium]
MHAMTETAENASKNGKIMSALIERKVCPACESGKFSTLFKEKFSDKKVWKFIERKFKNPENVRDLLADGNYELCKCRSCTLIFQRNILSDEYTSQLYDNWLIDEDAESELSKEKLAPRQLAYFANEVLTIGRLMKRPHHEIKVLDYGLGRGWWCQIAQAFGFDAYGTDLATRLVAQARDKGIKAIGVTELNTQRFDFINTEQVFEHLARPLDVLRQLREILGKTGVIKISVPEGRGLEKRIPLMDWSAPRWDKRYLVAATPLIHINTFTQRSIAAMAKRAGLNALTVPIRHHYSLCDTSSLHTIGKSLVRPLYRRLIGSNYVFLQAS